MDDARVEAATGGSVQPDDEASLNALREAARRRVKQTAPELTDHEIGILTLPTGLGKTFSGLSGAFALRDELQRARERETAPRIIYALPYTSIIEQTREIFETEVFEADPRGQAFTTHHYLAETVTYPNTETELGSSPDTDHAASRAKLLGESWRSGVVLTTFVQLFESLAGPSNAAGLKLPALHDAVIVLDEPQAVPKPWWDAIRRLTRTLIDTYDARVISMTATQPTLFTAGSFDTTSLLHTGAGESFQRQAYESVSRVRYYVDDSVRSLLKGDQGKPLGHGLAANRLLERALQPADEDSPTSVLAVCSTVASSRGLTEEVVEQAPAAGTQATHIGDAYRSALASLDKFDPEAQSDTHPKPEQLAHETLERLGFVKDETDTWRPGDGWTGHLLVGTFNARYRPLDRRALIHIADALSTAAVPFVFISTQAIEAGVDISFNHAYRDVAPLDSIVQTAGRCNRSFEWGVDGGTTTVWCLASPNDEETTLPAQYIYREAGHLSEIASLLHDVSDGTEEPIPAATLELETVQKYFDFVESRGFLDDDLKPWIEDSEAEKLGRKSLLGDEYETVDILVAATEADNKRLDHLRQQFAKYEGLGYERLNELSDMRVSVSIREMDDLSMHTRADGTGRQSNSGVDVFVHELGHGNGSYEFDAGFLVTESDVTNRFT
ncbi:DEAD/DEAH box helicase family protein [Halosegnis longus]|uniref:DEAD/DEAH box helicase family protein n=1 Tax=Halosegnis longus TaxID=2216012 RepID=UPI00096A98A8|nr:DEAD/DEAH box helicase family protein [Salella cibi]